MFENEERYRRKPDLIHAVRLTPEGMIPITHADTDWTKSAQADGRLKYSGAVIDTANATLAVRAGQWFANTGVALQAAYGGDWLVLHDATQQVEVLRNEAFRERFEAIPFAEDK